MNDGQKFKRDEKGCPGRGTSTSKVRAVPDPAYNEPSLDVKPMSRRGLGAVAAPHLQDPQSSADEDPTPALVGKKSASYSQSCMLERL